VGLFTSTAEFYDAYRSGVPDDVADVLSAAAPSGVPRRLLDVGTGTGFVIRALLPAFEEAIGVDPDRDLLAVAGRGLEVDVAAGRVALLHATAEDFVVPPGWRAHLVTVCRAFHWFDRPRFLERAAASLVPDGTIAVFGDRSVWASNAAWKAVALETVQEFLGRERRAGAGTYRAPEGDYADDLRRAGYRDVERRTIPVTRTRTVDSVIGYLHSTSFASLAVLGDAADAFDDRLRERLDPLVDDTALLVDENEFTVVTATAADDAPHR
jgi:SAM-dependent methyltransferase